MLTTFIYFPVKLGLLQLYPAYIGYKAIKANDQQQFGSLLTFWIVSIVYLAIEYFSDMFLFWMPFYTEIKLVIVLWLILPQTQGAALVYTRYLDPFLNQHETEIDHVLVEIQFRVKKTIVSYGKQCLKTLRKTLLQTIFRSKVSIFKCTEQKKRDRERDLVVFNMIHSPVGSARSRRGGRNDNDCYYCCCCCCGDDGCISR
ncbi:TB2/DP1, HVA22 family-domain-containing protein [Mycotypha africana]|uniref:TB2/DP1, HVA22 family-domain-containing protein n=1 Tax=Mycotypha africana TaxID=64632 RepID=UPI00230023A1|nr:TB2/DP1, HVA22 family-domain-containing protein [Mycotypha africana]KAI8990881.1 TB2/DP1, HVA22 family-domain-containing protein [Mycotypha africana]